MLHQFTHPPKIFISYTSQDVEKALELYRDLLDFGFDPWIDREKLLPGQDWHFEIIEAISKSDFFIACLSTNSVTKRWVIQEEIREALGIWKTKLFDDIYLIPVLLEKCEIPRPLQKFQWVDLNEEKSLLKIFGAIRVGMDKMGTGNVYLRSKFDPDLSIEEVKKKSKRV